MLYRAVTVLTRIIQICKKTLYVLLWISYAVFGDAVYHVALIQSRGSSLVVTNRTADVRVTLDRPVTLGLAPVELSTSISGSHVATYVVNIYVPSACLLVSMIE